MFINVGCYICTDPKTLSDLRILECGHCFCEDCTKRLQKVCGVCRAPKGTHRPIFINDLDADPADEARSAISLLENASLYTPSTSLSVAASKIRKVALACNGVDKETVAKLNESVSMLQERITPLYTEVELLSSENQTLKDELRSTRSMLSTSSSREDELKRTNNDLYNAVTYLQVAQQQLEDEKRRSAELEKKVGRRDSSLEKRKRAIVELETMNGELDRANGLLKKKLKVLSKDIKTRARAQGHNPDDSLLVEDPLELI